VETDEAVNGRPKFRVRAVRRNQRNEVSVKSETTGRSDERGQNPCVFIELKEKKEDGRRMSSRRGRTRSRCKRLTPESTPWRSCRINHDPSCIYVRHQVKVSRPGWGQPGENRSQAGLCPKCLISCGEDDPVVKHGPLLIFIAGLQPSFNISKQMLPSLLILG
jgi:hypothetical protein